MDALVKKIEQGDRRSLAQAMSWVEDATSQARTLKGLLRRSTGQVPWWGITGPPGVGKSTLIDALLTLLRKRGHRIGVIAIDPTSPISDGALLGDRVRMMGHAVDREIFIRSLATHRCEGGLSDATLHCARLMELAHFDPVLIETVGVGQNEVDVASVADLCVVMLGPGYGDDIQLIKAGLLEIADLVVVNKCDMPEANRLLNEVRAELELSRTAARAGKFDPNGTSACQGLQDADSPAVEAIGIEAKSGKGVESLVDKLLELDGRVRNSVQRKRSRRRRILGEIRRSATLLFEQGLAHKLEESATDDLLRQLEGGELSLESIAARLGAAVVEELDPGFAAKRWADQTAENEHSGPGHDRE